MAFSAADSLAAAFRGRCRAGDAMGGVGLFGDGLPEALVAATGAVPVEVKAPPPDDSDARAPEAVSEVIEDFVDPYAARFLHRLAAGWYDGLAALVFARDDVAALAAYQYATELRRQGRIAPGGPRFVLWNLVHDRSEAAHRFNMVQARRLLATLSDLSGMTGAEARLAAALVAEAGRAAALSRMQAAGVTGARAHVWRNAGRWLPPGRHTALIDAALAEEPEEPTGAPRIGLVGTAAIEPDLHAMLEEVGPVVADLQPYGAVWPACHAGGPDLDGLIRAVAAFPLTLRAAPPTRFRAALVDGLAGCDLVVSQVDASDDGFGWEVPGLRDAVTARGGAFVDLGFRPFQGDPAWRERALAQVRAATGVAA